MDYGSEIPLPYSFDRLKEMYDETAVVFPDALVERFEQVDNFMLALKNDRRKYSTEYIEKAKAEKAALLAELESVEIKIQELENLIRQNP